MVREQSSLGTEQVQLEHQNEMSEKILAGFSSQSKDDASAIETEKGRQKGEEE